MLTLSGDLAAPRPTFLTVLVWPTFGCKAKDGDIRGSRADPEEGSGGLKGNFQSNVLQGEGTQCPIRVRAWGGRGQKGTFRKA